MKREGCPATHIQKNGKCYPLKKFDFIVSIPITKKQPFWLIAEIERPLFESGKYFWHDTSFRGGLKRLWSLDDKLRGITKAELIKHLDENAIEYSIEDVYNKKGEPLE